MARHTIQQESPRRPRPRVSSSPIDRDKKYGDHAAAHADTGKVHRTRTYLRQLPYTCKQRLYTWVSSLRLYKGGAQGLIKGEIHDNTLHHSPFSPPLILALASII